MSWRQYQSYGGRRRTANGIRAKAQRGAFGTTWWAGRWLAALERLVDAGRLARGRTYARGGQVLNLDVIKGEVSARVQGSFPIPYAVSMRFAPLTDHAWNLVTDALAGQALFAAKLLAGEMPQEIEALFEAAGAPLFPATANDLTTECSCPDWSNPCKHTAAVYYLLGERFDEDPFLLFVLRGRTGAEIAAALRLRRSGDPATVPATEDLPPEEEQAAVPLLSGSTDAFWRMAAPLPEAPLSLEPPPVAALAVKRLGPPPFWHDGQDFAARMEALYAAIGAHARRTLLGDGE